LALLPGSWDLLPLHSKGVKAALEELAEPQDELAGRVDFALFNIAHRKILDA
jgi:hypothetical protein